MENRTRNILIIGSLVTLVGGIGLYLWRQYYLLTSIAVSLGSIRLNKLSLSELDIDLALKVTNSSDQSFVIDGYDLNVYLGDTFIANVKSNLANVKLNAKGIPSILPLKIVANPKQIFTKDTLPLWIKFGTDPMGGSMSVKGTLSIRHPLLYLKDYELDYVVMDDERSKQKR